MKYRLFILPFIVSLLILQASLESGAQTFNPPRSLRLSEWCYNYDFMWSVPDSSSSSVLYYNLYRDSEWIDSTMLRWCTVEFDSGQHTFGVSAVFEGGESEIVSRDLTAPLGKPARALEITYNLDQVDLMWDAPSYYFWVSWMNNFVGGYYPSGAVGPDSVTYVIKWPWTTSDEMFVAEFNEFEFMPAIYSGAGAVDFHFKIFQGNTIPHLIYFQDLGEIQYEDWNYVVIDPPLLIPASEDFYVGVTILNDPENGDIATMLVDDLQPEPWYGNLVSADDSVFFEAGDGGDWVMMGFYTNSLFYGDNIDEKNRDARAGYINQFDIYRNGEYIGYSESGQFTDTNFTKEDCGNFFEYYVVAQYNTCAAPPSGTVGTTLDCSNAIFESLAPNPVRIYPNPSNDFLYIGTELPVDEMLLRDIYGNDIYPISRKSDRSIQIETSNLAEGIYFLTIKYQGQQVVRKIAVIH